MKKCPFCAEEIQDNAIKCRYCFAILDKKIKPEEEKQSDFHKEMEAAILTSKVDRVARRVDGIDIGTGKKVVAFIVGIFLPGVGLLILKKLRGLFYLVISLLCVFISTVGKDAVANTAGIDNMANAHFIYSLGILCVFILIIIWIISIIDTAFACTG